MATNVAPAVSAAGESVSSRWQINYSMSADLLTTSKECVVEAVTVLYCSRSCWFRDDPHTILVFTSNAVGLIRLNCLMFFHESRACSQNSPSLMPTSDKFQWWRVSNNIVMHSMLLVYHTQKWIRSLQKMQVLGFRLNYLERRNGHYCALFCRIW